MTSQVRDPTLPVLELMFTSYQVNVPDSVERLKAFRLVD